MKHAVQHVQVIKQTEKHVQVTKHAVKHVQVIKHAIKHVQVMKHAVQHVQARIQVIFRSQIFQYHLEISTHLRMYVYINSKTLCCIIHMYTSVRLYI